MKTRIRRIHWYKWIVIPVICFFTLENRLKAQEMWKELKGFAIQKEDNTLVSVLFSITGKCRYNIFRLEKPSRLVLEIENAQSVLGKNEREIAVKGGFIKKLRINQYKDKPVKMVRAVFDLQEDDIAYRLTPVSDNILIEVTPASSVSEKKTVQKAEEKAAPAVPSGKTETGVVKTAAIDSIPSEYTVVPGDTLSRISARFYGKPDYWHKIFQFNKELISSPESLASGTVLKLPGISDMKKIPAIPAVSRTEKPAEELPAEKKESVKEAETKAIIPRIAAKIETSPSGQLSQKLFIKTPEIPAAHIEQVARIKAASGERPVSVTLDFTEADIRDVLTVLAEEMNLNIICEEGVSGEITIHLKDSSFEDALDAVLSQKSYSYEVINPNTIRILSKPMSITQIIQLNYALASEVAGMISGMLSTQAKVLTDTRQNSLIITDSSEYINKVKRMISILDQKPRQVMIEARILEVSLGKNMDLGINWQYAGTVAGPVGQSANPVNVTETSIDVGGLVSGSAKGVSTLGTFYKPAGTGVAFAGASQLLSVGVVMNKAMLDMTLSALTTNNKVRTLSNPRIATLNNKAANIMVGDKIPYIGATAVGSASTSQTSFLDVGIMLTVLPIINQDDRITLQITATVSAIGGTGTPPPIKNRTASTNLLVKDGETIVIGGLISETKALTDDQIPILGDIPLLGYLFKHRTDIYSRGELLIFISPSIIRE